MSALRASAFALLLLAPLALPAVTAQGEPRTVFWEYRLSLPDPDSGNVRVELRVKNAEGVLTKLTFATQTQKVPVSNVTGLPDTPLDFEPGGFSFVVDGNEGFTYDVRVEEDAFRDGERLAHAGADFALFKAESLQLEFHYAYYARDDGRFPFTNETSVRLLPPAGWDAAAPWEPTGPGGYRLPADAVQPRGYVAMGTFLEDRAFEAGGKTFRYARLGAPGAFETEMEAYLGSATTYYATAYGPGVGPRVLIVNAPSPMFHGGLGGYASFFVHEDVDLRTLAHEYAHVFQQFATRDDPPRSAIWLNEGDADLQSALSLAAAGVWGPRDVNAFLQEARRDEADPNLNGATLPHATYGGPLEKFAYHKGAVVLKALDELLLAHSDNRTGVVDVLRALNARHLATAGREAQSQVTNEEVQEVASRLVGLDLAPFFERYVAGDDWPATTPFVAQGQLAVDDLVLEPPRAVPGESVLARVNVTNRGTSPLSRSLDFLLDGQFVASRPVDLDVGETVPLRVTFSAPDSGDHEVRVLYARAALRSLSPPNLSFERVSYVPATVRAGSPVNMLVFVQNAGERPGSARVEVMRDGAPVAKTTESLVDGLTTLALTVPLQFSAPGTADLLLSLHTSNGTHTREEQVTIAEADRDADGVPDASDAYPDDPAASDRSLTRDVRTPGAPLWAIVLVLAAVAFRRRRA